MSVARSLVCLVAASLLGCTSNPPGLDVDAGDTGSDADADADIDSDVDGDADADGDGDTDACEDVLEWVAIEGGVFMMGGPEDTPYNTRLPIHEVTVSSFEMTRTEITAAQYRCCFVAEACTEPQPSGTIPDTENCNWDLPEEDDRPINCINWQQAVEFCEWAGGRLPSEAEWEYAARGQGEDVTYPWGEAEPTCEYAVMGPAGSEIGPGCGEERTWDVCSKPAGNTHQGLCDMAGNVWEWVQDCYHSDYENAPADGSAWEDECDQGSDAVARGGGYKLSHLECRNRTAGAIDNWATHLGFRCVR